MGLEAGQMLGRYKLASKLGSGAFGSVWLAEDTWLSKRVALKVPHNQEQDFSKMIEEPKLLASMDHPNIIKLLTVDKVEGTIFMVMEYVEGQSLKDRIQKAALPIQEAVDLARGMLEALAYAHQKGLVHRDLKPANILLTPQGQAKITDFGTAHAINAGEATMAAGTLFYMPKEQLIGRVTPQSDLYAVGVMLFEMLTQKVPLTEDNGQKLIQKILSETPPPDVRALNAGVSEDLAGIIRRAITSDMGIRWKKAEDFLSALNDFKAGKKVVEAPAMPAATLPAYERFSRKVPRLVDTLNTTHSYEPGKVIGSRGRSGGQFLLPAFPAFGPEGDLFVTDSIRNCVLIFDREGGFAGALGSEGGVLDQGVRFRNPSGIAIDRAGMIYVADTKNSRILIFDRAEHVEKQFGRSMVVMGLHAEKDVIGFNFPRGIALDESSGILYVSDTGNNRLRSFTMGGIPVATFGSLGDRTDELNAPIGMAVGSNGRLYVADSQNHRIQVFDKEFRFVESIGRRGNNPGDFPYPPTSVFISINDELVVCDNSDRLHVFGSDGRFVGMVSVPRPGSTAPKAFAGAFHDAGDIILVDENGCQLMWLHYRERKK